MKEFDGIPIDSSWLSTYQDQGLVGDVLQGLVLVSLLIVALISPRGPGRAVALFLVVYLAVESFTQTGLGQPSSRFLGLGCGHVVADAAFALGVTIRDFKDQREIGLSQEGGHARRRFLGLATQSSPSVRLYGLNATPNKPALSAFGAMNRFSIRCDLTKSTNAELPSTSSEINKPPARMNGQAFSNSYFIV